MKVLRSVGIALCAAVVLTACATEPSQDELTEAILVATNADPDLDLTEAQARCIAGELLASNLSDTTLAGLAEDFDSPEVLETEVDDVEPLVAAAAIACR